jgi:hypothetical protein
MTLLPPDEARVGSPVAGSPTTGAGSSESTAEAGDAPADGAEGETAGASSASAAESLDEEVSYTRTELPDDAYDHLWGATVVKSVEEAAVRELDDDEHEAESSPQPAGPAPVVAPAPTADPQSAAPVSTPSPSAPAGPPSAGLIDSVPDFARLGAASGSSDVNGRTVPPANGRQAGDATGRDLANDHPNDHPAGAASAGVNTVADRTAIGTTPATSGSDPAGRPTSTDPAPGGIEPAGRGLSGAAQHPAPGSVTRASAPDDDHDGLTVTVSELEAMRRLGAADEAAAGASVAAPAAPDAPAPGAALGHIVLSTGERYDLDRPVIIGRRPRANRVQADQVPVLVTVASPEQDISRNHLEIRLEGRHVLVVDLATTNGSVLHRDGTPPLRLGPNEPVLVLSNDVVDLGDGVTVEFEDIP